MGDRVDIDVDFARWVREGQALRERLLSERAALQRRIEAVDLALATLPPGDHPHGLARATRNMGAHEAAYLQANVSSMPTPDGRPDGRHGSMMQQIAHTVSLVADAHGAEGVAAPEILAWLRRSNIDVDAKSIHTYLARLTQNGVIHAHGERAERRYFSGAHGPNCRVREEPSSM